MTSRLILSAIGAAMALAANAPAEAQNFITNGGFEDQLGFTGNPYDYSTSPTAWTTNAAWDSGYNAAIGSAYGNPHSGSVSVRFGFSRTGAATMLGQTFADVIGGLYTVSFYTYNGQYVGDSDDHSYVTGGHPNNFLTASVGDASVTVPDNVGTFSNGCATCWVSRSFSFTRTGSDTLSFAALTDANYWHLDDVTVTGPALGTVTGAVPEPAMWAMMLVGVGAVGAGLRRRRREDKPALA